MLDPTKQEVHPGSQGPPALPLPHPGRWRRKALFWLIAIVCYVVATLSLSRWDDFVGFMVGLVGGVLLVAVALQQLLSLGFHHLSNHVPHGTPAPVMPNMPPPLPPVAVPGGPPPLYGGQPYAGQGYPPASRTSGGMKQWMSLIIAAPIGCFAAVVGTVVVLAVVLGVVYFVINNMPDANADRRNKLISAYNAYIHSDNTARDSWVQFIKDWQLFSQGSNNKDQCQKDLQACKDAVAQIHPYDPPGVDPALADAINNSKNAWETLLSSDITNLDVSSGFFGTIKGLGEIQGVADQEKPVNDATDKVTAEENRIASEIGGIVSKP